MATWAGPTPLEYEKCASIVAEKPECAYELMVAEASLKAEPKDLVRLLAAAKGSPNLLGMLNAAEGSDLYSGQALWDAADAKIASIVTELPAEEYGRILMWMDAWPTVLLGNRLYRSAHAFLMTRSGKLTIEEQRLFDVAFLMHAPEQLLV